ncbi:MAG: hypothetical protein ACI4N1_12865 [Stenotrophomonas koreensis]
MTLRKIFKITPILSLLLLTSNAMATEPSTEVHIQVYADGVRVYGTQELIIQNPTPTIDDVAAVMNSQDFTVRRMESRQITVKKSTNGEPFVDVTSDPKLMIINSTPWMISMSPTHVLTADIDPSFTIPTSAATDPTGRGTFDVIYLDQANQKAGSTRIPVHIAD